MYTKVPDDIIDTRESFSLFTFTNYIQDVASIESVSQNVEQFISSY